ncbi:cytochrome P450 [Pseudovirgaria hyperparasitica]|uniref:Cytochrome P450 n=1 Tax=Pseudovirgaria hyperparasitica TaxID=470096 RepID=A0A6A6WGY7_9PEZI|nr:cytochrome P450 [Pseudovirgaria hyperparasitica]KAF2762068.1 cytochrome P450 [Pseudovirgaria hyperparasitica]
MPVSVLLLARQYEFFLFSNSHLVTKTFLIVAYAFLISKLVLPYFTSPLRPLPAPQTSHFFLGHSQEIEGLPPGQVFRKWIEQVPNQGVIHYKGYLHLGSAIHVTTPEAMMDVVSTHAYHYEKPGMARKLLSMILGNGLVNVEGDEHKKQRKNVTPAFSGRHIKDLVPIFWAKGHQLGDVISREARKDGSLEVTAPISRATLDIIGSACIGKDFNTLENSDNALAKQYSSLFDIKSIDMLLYYLTNEILPYWLAKWIPLRATVTISQAASRLREITSDLLTEKQQGMNDGIRHQNDIIAILTRTGNFTDDTLTDQLLTFLAAGHETTSSTLSWALYILATHPDIQIRLRNELQPLLHTDSVMTADILDSSSYLQAFLSELLRLYPAAPLTTRVTLRPTTIANIPIPTGVLVIIPIWALNRASSTWGPDADLFRPERWMEDSVKGGAPALAFNTFLHGPRSCIGQGFARYELKALLAALLARFEFELAQGQGEPVPDGMFTVKPRGGLRVKVREL